MTIIRGYGEFWNAELVCWGSKGNGNRGELKGEAHPGNKKKSGYEVDMWKASAVYCLYSDFKVVYVGKSNGDLGARLRHHRKDHKQGRWELFSFYSLSLPAKNGRCTKAGQRQVAASEITQAFEAVAIRMFDPPLNRRHEGFDPVKRAIPIVQSGEIETAHGRLHRIETRLDELGSS